MEFPFDTRRVLKPDTSEIAIVEATSPAGLELSQIINDIGFASSQAQGLRTIITTASRFFSSSDQKLYIKLQGNLVVGFLKIGFRRLFHTNGVGKMTEMYPLCLLDFYIHENLQRHGFGKELYEKMLLVEKINPRKIAIDRPSMKLLYFMRKHYSLSEYVPQSSNYVIFEQYFDTNSSRISGNFRNNARNILGNRFTPVKPSNNHYRPIPPWASSEVNIRPKPSYKFKSNIF